MAIFNVTLSSCLTCDERRVDVGDQIDIHLDLVKLPNATSPVRAVVLEVRSTQPPEPATGVLTLVVQCPNSALPEGFTTLEFDDISYVQCVGCCIQNSERLDSLEEVIIGTHETFPTTLSPFAPASFELIADGSSEGELTYDGELNGKPFWSNGGTYPFLRFIDGFWTFTRSIGVTYVANQEAAYPWLFDGSEIWVRSPGVAINEIEFKDVTYDYNSPLAPASYDDLLLDNDLIFTSDRDGTIWQWVGTTWETSLFLIPWDIATEVAPPSPRIGALFIATSSGTYNGSVVYANDIFIRRYPDFLANAAIKIGSQGTFSNIGVTTNTNQVITGSKNFVAAQIFDVATITSAAILGGSIANTPIGSAGQSSGSFTTLKASGRADLVGVTHIGADSSSAAPATGQILLHRADSTFAVTDSPALLTANRSQTRPDKAGTVAIVASSTGLPSISEVSGIAYGKATLVAGTVAVNIAGLATTSVIIGLTPQVSLNQSISGACTANTLTITSTSNTDTRVINYAVIL